MNFKIPMLGNASEDRFICDESQDFFAFWLQGHDEKSSRAKTAMAFIEKQAKALDEEINQSWLQIFNEIKSRGLVPENAQKEEWAMRFGGEDGKRQLFIRKITDQDLAMEALRKMLNPN